MNFHTSKYSTVETLFVWLKNTLTLRAETKRSVMAAVSFLGLFYVGLVNAEFNVRTVTAVEAAELLKQDPEIQVLDVRTGFEFRRGHLENAVNVNYYSRKFRANLDKLDKDVTWLVHCHSGVRSSKTMPLMEALGFTSVIDVSDGIVGWNKAGLPTVK